MHVVTCEYLLKDTYTMLPMHAATCNYSNNVYTIFLTCVNIFFMFLTYIYIPVNPIIYIYIHIKKKVKREKTRDTHTNLNIYINNYIHKLPGF